MCGYLHRAGAAIIRSAKSSVPLVFEKTFLNPLCFLQFENATTPPDEIEQVNRCTVHIHRIRMVGFVNKIIHVTGFVKRGLPHASNLLILMISNFRLVNAVDLKCGKQKAPTLVNGWRKFQLHTYFDIKPYKFMKLDVCGRPLFANPVT